MKRRSFLAGATVTAAVGVQSPAIAQSSAPVKWRLTSSFPKSLDTIYGGVETIAKIVHEITDGRFQIQPFAGGELVPPLQAIDAVQIGTLEMCHSASFYNLGKDPAWAIGAALPFGLNARQQNAWMYDGGGGDLLDSFYARNNLVAFPAGNTGAQMGGWFRREIKSIADMKGLKFRVSGLTGRILGKLGVVVQTIPGGDIFPSLERGTIDAAEWIGPYDDEKLGFVRIAPNYYYPGWWEGGVVVHAFINQAKWNELPKSYQDAIRIACQATNADMLAKYDARNPMALKRLVAAGAQLRAFPKDIMDASYAASKEVYAEAAAQSAEFKKLYESMKAFRDDSYLWWQIGEAGFDLFNMQNRGK
jgi:TRAP-type mannitol/chloroaromatic compound transport system substrate-binding protein